ncbi:hypothetical protein WEB32_09120 [Streptomyces netropsis]|uniref:Uncharacterized protein n=1 Tax=Streptomyces netropsis TaxID=55404 RepID=A0A7W7PCR1_STRNE|nr:hypothetical protein [Streptomyces netropsis]MBB4884807.1 hypothetical protein [Streptomyces netropsis]GGR01163.1 hypothetical protein GCM10010219_01000 [Streptomyces netropsis]
MSAKSRIVAVTVLTAAAGAVLWPAADALAADKDTRPARTVTQQVLLPDGSRARLHSGSAGTSVDVTSRGTQRTLDATRPAADVNRLHLRILGGDGTHPTLRASLDGSRLTHYYDFASGSLRYTPDGSDLDRLAATGDTLKDYRHGARTAAAPATRATPAGDAARADLRTGDHTDAGGDHADVRRDDRETGGKVTGKATGKADRAEHGTRLATSSNPVKRVVQAGAAINGRHDIGTPALAGAVLLTLGGGAYAVRFAVRRSGRADA